MEHIKMYELGSLVFDVEKGKAPRPAGFLVDFFQKMWHIIHTDLMTADEETRSSCKYLTALSV